MIKKNDEINLTIDDLTTDGDGIARYNNLVFFVKNALPGDEIVAGVTKIKKNYGYARIIDFIKKSPDRVSPPFNVHEKCGGCVLQNLSYEAQLKYKEKLVISNLSRIGGFNNIKILPIINSEQPYFYRNKVQYPVRRLKDGKIHYGFYSPHSHILVPNESCLIQNNEIDELMKMINNDLNIFNIDCYNEINGCGYLRHVIIRRSQLNGSFMVGFVINSKNTTPLLPIVNKIKNFNNVKSIIANINKDNTNVILGNTNKLLYGDEYIIDAIGDIKYKISLNSFFQVNDIQNKVLYDVIDSFANFDINDSLIDLYCGIGSIGLYLNKKVCKIYGIEIVPSAIDDAKYNAELNNIDNAEYFLGDATNVFSAFVKNGIKVDNIIVDPPRKGLSNILIDDIVNSSPKNIIYVSCDSATLSRDLRSFVDKGYIINKIQPVDMFPMTTHVETVCLMTRKER